MVRILIFIILCFWLLLSKKDKTKYKTVIAIDEIAIRFGTVSFSKGDTIVFLYPGVLGDNSVRFLEAARARFPDNQVIVLENGLSVGVMRRN